MGWGRTFLLGDIGNRLDIADVEESLRSIKSTLRNDLRKSARVDMSQDMKISQLEEENEKLHIAVSALASILTMKGVCSKSEIEKLGLIIDEENG